MAVLKCKKNYESLAGLRPAPRENDISPLGARPDLRITHKRPKFSSRGCAPAPRPFCKLPPRVYPLPCSPPIPPTNQPTNTEYTLSRGVECHSPRDIHALCTTTDCTERETHVRSSAAGWYQRSHSGAVSGMLTCHARAGTTRGVTLAPSSRPSCRPSCRPSSHAAARPLQQRFEGAHATRPVDLEELYELLVE
jgi:hypothetical protein